MATRTIDFIRHGQYGEDGLLTPVGVAQIELLAARYRSQGGPTELWQSSMPRAMHTGRVLGRALGLTARTVALLGEGVPTVPDPRPSWMAPERTFDLERVASHRARFDRVLERVLKPARGTDKHLLLACHGNATRYMWCTALGLDPVAWWGFRIHHASLSRIQVLKSGRVVGVSLNEVGHLPPALQSE
ncbi:MAG: histidine phosphatase family protein [Myxococcales bacterium]|nr:histidine phosphatase family protein [Myxococcales bacterium]MCB9693085.1 histidine phosphatase family protein [Alphaproteobacteria bacterium]